MEFEGLSVLVGWRDVVCKPLHHDGRDDDMGEIIQTAPKQKRAHFTICVGPIVRFVVIRLFGSRIPGSGLPH